MSTTLGQDKINKLFTDLGDLQKLWSVGVAFNRSNPVPLDKTSIFQTKDDADAYINQTEGNICYPGQLIATVEVGSTKVYVTQLKDNGQYDLVEIGSVSNALVYKGIAIGPPTANGTTLPISSTTSVTATSNNTGHIYIYDNVEYISNGEKWEELGPNIDISIFLTKDAAARLYLTQDNAAKTYATKELVGDNSTTDIGTGDYTNNLTLSQRINRLKNQLFTVTKTEDGMITDVVVTEEFEAAVKKVAPTASVVWEDISTNSN